MDGSILTYVYLDGAQQLCEQVGEGYSSSIDLVDDWQVTKGEHVVDAVQYADNDPSGKILFYRSAKFEVKERLKKK